MRRLERLALGVGVLAMAGCGQAISADYNPSTQFSQYRTFAMVSRPDSASQQLLDDRVRGAVAGELAAKGLTRTDREHADLFVGYGIVDHTYTAVEETDWPWVAYGWRFYRFGVAWPMDAEQEITNYTDGTVVVSLVDARTHRVVWRGQADDVLRLPVKNPDRASTQIAQAVDHIFNKFPPANRA
jgi:hypothetical protein